MISGKLNLLINYILNDQIVHVKNQPHSLPHDKIILLPLNTVNLYD